MAALDLLPGKPLETPSGCRIALVLLVELALESVQYIIDIGEAYLLECDARIDGAIAAAANNHHRAVDARGLFYLRNKVRINFPIRSIVPRNYHRADGMADKKELHFAAAINEQRIWIHLQERMGLTRLEMLHEEMTRIDGLVV